MVNIKRLKQHVKLCKRNLKNRRVRCCAKCPFEETIVKFYPNLKNLFEEKRAYHGIS